jgi:SusD family.
MLLLMAACDSKLDIVPKGKTVLDNIDDLKLLLNQMYTVDTPLNDLSIICNESYSYYNRVPIILAQNNTLAKAYLAYDESIDRTKLVSQDSRYNQLYSYINYMNVLIDKIDVTEGDETMKMQISAEAHIMRAYFHWLLVNLFASQYNNAETASQEGGIPYVNDLNIQNIKEKQTLGQVYDNILADCADEYIKALPDKHSNIYRGDKAWGNAVRAKVLMQMKRYSDALPYALTSLQYNSTIQDRSTIMTTYDWSLPRVIDDNLVLIAGPLSPYGEALSIETVAKFEPGDYVKDYARYGATKSGDYAWSPIFGLSKSGIDGSLYYVGSSTYINTWGITSDRMYYTAAECYIRIGKYQEGLDLVNKVRKYRIDSTHYTEFKASTEDTAMKLLQKAKWIECIATYENFFDCKRWNTEDNYKTTITRVIPNIGTYSLRPDSPLWIFPFGSDNVSFNPTLTQNY